MFAAQDGEVIAWLLRHGCKSVNSCLRGIWPASFLIQLCFAFCKHELWHGAKKWCSFVCVRHGWTLAVLSSCHFAFCVWVLMYFRSNHQLGGLDLVRSGIHQDRFGHAPLQPFLASNQWVVGITFLGGGPDGPTSLILRVDDICPSGLVFTP